MTTRILLSTTSYQDTPGPHHALLESQGFEIVRERGPLPEKAMLELAGEFDAFLCGDDEITEAVLGCASLRQLILDHPRVLRSLHYTDAAASAGW